MVFMLNMHDNGKTIVGCILHQLFYHEHGVNETVGI